MGDIEQVRSLLQSLDLPAGSSSKKKKTIKEEKTPPLSREAALKELRERLHVHQVVPIPQPKFGPPESLFFKEKKEDEPQARLTHGFQTVARRLAPCVDLPRLGHPEPPLTAFVDSDPQPAPLNAARPDSPTLDRQSPYNKSQAPSLRTQSPLRSDTFLPTNTCFSPFIWRGSLHRHTADESTMKEDMTALRAKYALPGCNEMKLVQAARRLIEAHGQDVRQCVDVHVPERVEGAE
eukprot:GEMP01057567.1.p1 GENE.GEMP01057567.1~~GEMP01057567.1.p1  ORF type:complete len:236 (+),score=47.61 GEMP01057567.1:121-828(+)